MGKDTNSLTYEGIPFFRAALEHIQSVSADKETGYEGLHVSLEMRVHLRRHF